MQFCGHNTVATKLATKVPPHFTLFNALPCNPFPEYWPRPVLTHDLTTLTFNTCRVGLLSVLAVPEPPRISYEPSDTVYDGEMVSITCTSDTPDPSNTEVIWLHNNEKIDGTVQVRPDSVINSIEVLATPADSSERYECHVLHRNLASPLVAEGLLNGSIHNANMTFRNKCSQ